jgi:hypothetical protein
MIVQRQSLVWGISDEWSPDVLRRKHFESAQGVISETSENLQ